MRGAQCRPNSRIPRSDDHGKTRDGASGGAHCCGLRWPRRGDGVLLPGAAAALRPIDSAHSTASTVLVRGPSWRLLGARPLPPEMDWAARRREEGGKNPAKGVMDLSPYPLKLGSCPLPVADWSLACIPWTPPT